MHVRTAYTALAVYLSSAVAPVCACCVFN